MRDRSSARNRNQRSGGGFTGRLPLAATLFLLLLGWLVAIGALPQPVLWLYLTMSLLTFAAYAQDKRAATRGAWRTQESTLQVLALLGGWPGALLAQQWLRHKSAKRSFLLAFWLLVTINVCVLGLLAVDPGAWTGTVHEYLRR